MKKNYSRKQIVEAINYWKKQLKESRKGGTITLVGCQELDGQPVFKNEIREITSLEDYRAFYEEISQNARHMFGVNCDEERVGTFGFRFNAGRDYEEWTED